MSHTQAPEERQRLVKLVLEEPLPADAPPLPEENQSDDTGCENDGGEKWFGPNLTIKQLLLGHLDHYIIFYRVDNFEDVPLE